MRLRAVWLYCSARGSFCSSAKLTTRRRDTQKKAHLLSLNCAGILVRADFENDAAIQGNPAAFEYFSALEYLQQFSFLLRTSATWDFKSAGIFNLRKTQQPLITWIRLPVRVHKSQAREFLVRAGSGAPSKKKKNPAAFDYFGYLFDGLRATHPF